jgi:hypothetical protein
MPSTWIYFCVVASEIEVSASAHRQYYYYKVKGMSAIDVI